MENKNMSSLQKDINKLKKTCSSLNNKNKMRKFQITQYTKFIEKLLDEKRITKEEIANYNLSKKKVKDVIN